MELVKLISTSNLADIALIKSLLDSEDITYFAHGENFHLVQPLIEPVQFLVSPEDLERATILIEGLRLSFSPLAGASSEEES